MRMTRKRRREYLRRRRREKTVRQGTAAAAFGLLALGAALRPVLAASHDVLHDVRSSFSYMADAQNEILGYRAAEAAVVSAKLELADARKNLADASASRKEAAGNLVLAQRNLEAARAQLAATEEALRQAQAALAQKTQAVLAAQRAEAEYAPMVEEASARVDALTDEQAATEDAYETEIRTLTERRAAEREAVVASVLERVHYEQNRIVDAQRMVEEELAGLVTDTTEIDASYTARLDGISADLDAAQADLDAVQETYDNLVSAREDAEGEEQDARATVADYEKDRADGARDVAQGAADLAEAQRFDAEAAAWMAQAQADAQASERQLAQSEHDLAHFGEGSGFQTGLEYYAWRGARSGHQLYLPLSFYERTQIGGQKVDFGLSTGYLQSNTGFAGGSVSGWTDTTLSMTLRNDKPVNQVHYGFAVSMPTGHSRFARYSVVPEGLAHFTDFGAGWQFIPSLEVTHRYSDADSLTGRLSYSFRGSYDYAEEVDGASVSPGDIFAQEIEFLHADGKRQDMVQLYHNATSGTVQDNVDYDTQAITGKSHYRDGDDWELSFFHNRKVSPKDEFRFYTILAWTDATHGIASESIGRQYYGTGLRHYMTPTLSWEVMANYQKVSSTSDPLRTELNTAGGFTRRSVLAALNYQASERDTMTLQAERYVRRDDGGAGYQGWGMTLWYQKSF